MTTAATARLPTSPLMSLTASLPGVLTRLKSRQLCLISLVSALSMFPRTLVSLPTAQALSLSELPLHPHLLLLPRLLFLQLLATLPLLLQPLATLLPQDLPLLPLLLARSLPMPPKVLLRSPLLRLFPQLQVIPFPSPRLHTRPR